MKEKQRKCKSGKKKIGNASLARASNSFFSLLLFAHTTLVIFFYLHSSLSFLSLSERPTGLAGNVALHKASPRPRVSETKLDPI